jgi:capsular polysaccharide biosynthesis protein
MAGPSAPPPAPQVDLIRRIRTATITRAVIQRKGRYHLGAVYDADGALVRESLRFPDKHRARDPKSLAMVQGPKVERRIARGLYLGHAFTHFGHFLIETVPALWWARQVDDDVALIFHPFDEAGRNVFAETAHGRDCLALLGLAPDRIVMATADLEVEELLLPPRHYDMRTGPRYDFREVYRNLVAAAQRSQTVQSAQFPPPRPRRVRVGATADQLDTTCGGENNPHPSPPPAWGRERSHASRIYLSRRLLKRRLRRLSNDAAAERRLARRGFTIVHPQHMSLVDQINTAANADVIAGVDGSALHLSAFMRPGARMLVLQTKRRRTIHFMNALMEVETISVPASGAPGAKRIDVVKLDRALDGLGCPRPGLLGRLLGWLDR